MRYGVHLFNMEQNVFENAFKSLGVPDTKTLSEVSDTDIISAFYDERGRTITQTDVDNFPSRYTSADIGKLFHFKLLDNTR